MDNFKVTFVIVLGKQESVHYSISVSGRNKKEVNNSINTKIREKAFCPELISPKDTVKIINVA